MALTFSSPTPGYVFVVPDGFVAMTLHNFAVQADLLRDIFNAGGTDRNFPVAWRFVRIPVAGAAADDPVA